MRKFHDKKLKYNTKGEIAVNEYGLE